MALNMKLADAYVDLTLNPRQFDAGMVAAIAKLNALKGLGAVNLTMGNAAAMASLNQVSAKLAAIRKEATITVRIRTAFSGLFGGGGSGRGGGNLVTGLMQGVGLAGFAASPGQMVGQMIGGGLKDAVGHAMELEQTFTGLQRVSGESAANVDRFKKTIFEVGKTQAGVSIKDLTDISMAGAKAGITDKEGLAGLETFTRGMAKVRNSVSGIGTEQLADNMVRMLNLFHKGTDYVQSFGSVLARMDNISTSSAGDILDMSKSLSGTFASLGMGIPQVMAFSSVLSDVGLTNQQGASSFSQILRMMASDSADMATKIGVPVDVFQQKVRTDAMGALGMLIARFRELNEVDPIKAQEFIAGLGFRGVKTAGALQQLSSIFEQVQERTQMAIEEETSLGSLQAANNLNSTTAIGNVQMLKNAFEQLGDAIGSKVVPHLTEMSRAALSLVNGMSGGKAGGPEDITWGESLERLKLTTQDPFKMIPEHQQRIAEINRKQEAFSAFQNGKALEAGPAAQDPGFKPNADLQAVRDGWANAAKVGVEEAAPNMDVGFGMARARDNDRKQAEAMAADRMQAQMERGAVLARPGGEQDWGKVSEFRKKFMDPAFVKQQDAMAREEDKLEGKGDKKFQSQHFGDSADFARNAIQTALSDKDDTPKLTLREQQKANDFLKTLVEKVTAGTPLAATNNGPMVLRGPA